MPSTSLTATLYVAAPFGTRTFDPSIDGVDPITAEGTEVPRASVKAVKAAARRYGVQVSQRS